MKKLFAILAVAGAVALLAVTVSIAADCNKKCCKSSTASSGLNDPTKQEVVVDPVCGMDVTVGKDTPSHEYNGKTYYFCSKSCMESFAKDPSKYIGEEKK
ncbi:MAG: YHS domain-containing protein [Nitrospirae bacterium]|nr:YHS domain-containing protein [Nitrospirota bacterium]MBI5695288.1 YHS domain-containing protein [Nitrospirota bacterium]